MLGDEVNLAARLEGLTRHYPVDVIISESLYDKLEKVRCLWSSYTHPLYHMLYAPI